VHSGLHEERRLLERRLQFGRRVLVPDRQRRRRPAEGFWCADGRRDGTDGGQATGGAVSTGGAVATGGAPSTGGVTGTGGLIVIQNKLLNITTLNIKTGIIATNLRLNTRLNALTNIIIISNIQVQP
jgi:hypothetical protein